ncbi:hypothetical protein [Lactobacillus crispatus]|uniref:hypothetical protein n=1 Tax=Lactobacillus crispatus TaxID=47770 RepID=UPI00211B5A8B|nr:hypothetical protein [Lactobacillus crispatus]
MPKGDAYFLCSNLGGYMKTLAFVLTTIFVIAKIMGFIAWSWWLVFAPLIALIVFYIGVLAVGGLCMLITYLINQD